MITSLTSIINDTGLFTDGDWIESKDQDPEGDVRIIQLADIGIGEFKNKSNRYMTKDRALDLNCTFLEPGDILVARMPDPIGRACIMPNLNQKCVTAVDVCIIRVDESITDREWLMWKINSPKYNLKIQKLQSGTTRKRISRKNLGKIEFFIPPKTIQIQERKKINLNLHFSEEMNVLNKHMSQKLDFMKSSMMKSACEGDLVPIEAVIARKENRNYESAELLLNKILINRKSNFEEKNPARKYKQPIEPILSELPELPEGWCYATIDQLSHRVTKGTTPTSVGFSFTDKGIRFVKAESLDGLSIIHSMCAYTSIDAHNALARSQLQEDDLLITIAGTLGRTAIVSANDIPANTNQAVSITRLVDRRLIQYIHLFVTSPMMLGKYQAQGKGSGLKNLNLNQIRESVIPLPPLAEIIRIILHFKSNFELFSKVEKENFHVSKLSELLYPSILSYSFSVGEWTND